MKRFWTQVSKKDLIFGVCIFVIVILMAVFQSSSKIKVSFGEEALDVKASRYALNIPYHMVERTELVEMPDRGEVIDGADDMSARTGHWENEAWGEYHVCADLTVPTCIVVYLDNGSTFVFNHKNADETQAVYDTLLSHLEP